MDEVVLATWPQTQHKLVRVIGSDQFRSRQTLGMAITQKATRRLRDKGRAAVLFVVRPSDEVLLQLIVNLNDLDNEADDPLILKSSAEIRNTINEIYGYYLRFFPLLNIGDLPGEPSPGLTPTDPGPLQETIDVSSYRLLGLRIPWLWPLNEFRAWHQETTS